jgi:hypothetical protein
MSSDVRDFKELQDRLLKLENQNRRFKQFGVTALIVLVSVVVMGQVPSGKTVEANEFILRDGSGTVRARLSMDETRSGPEMVLLDEKGRPRIKLEGGGQGAFYGGIVRVFDSQGQLRGLFSGRDMGGGISLLDSEGHPKTTLFPGDVWVNGGVRLEDDDGFAAWLGRTNLLYEGQARTASAASLILVDNPHRKVLWKAP